ncbi:actin-2-like [Mercenaria mercenaria]|uniref:actin-2-like n=1 Tax=Mercenaria mercenaria TaxID=6596 RepID=UPI001E1D9D68|nr:actin-2-like [Mercenaria mercenaria]XP_045169906.1 actin-2-like [Mercenaria mercenaria]
MTMKTTGKRNTVVIDPGSDTLKAGFAGDDSPTLVCRDLIFKAEGTHSSLNERAIKSVDIELPGHEQCHLTEVHPVANGIVVDWDVMQDIYDKTMTKLEVNSEEQNVFIAEPPLNPNYMREKLAEIMFEYLDVQALYLQDTSVLSLLSSGLTTGTVVESGDSTTYTSVVYEGRLIRETIPKTFYAGRSLTYHLSKMISDIKDKTFTVDPLPYSKAIKEKLVFVSEDYDADLKLAKSTDFYERIYTLPDGETIKLNEERLMCGEGLFKPDMFNCNCPGLHLQVQRTLNLAEADIRNSACKNIVLSGGNTMFSGITMRLQIEMNKIFPSGLHVKVKEIPRAERHYAAWSGGSIMASLSSMDSKWVTRLDYNDHGPAVINKMCKS